MAKKPEIKTIASGYYSRQALNNNFENLQAGFDNTLSLDGSTPNAMGADLDMNSNDILNASLVDTDALKINGTLVGVGDLSAAGASLSSISHTGDGSTVAFSTGYQAFITDNTQVYIDGVYQNKTGYSISGTTLTFSEAPPLNAAIEIVVARTLDFGADDAANVNYNQGSTGSVNRTVLTKLQETVSVKDFGAVGDGVTDDTTAIQAAIDSLPAVGGSLTFPQTSAGIYLLSSKPTVGSKKIVCKFEGETVLSSNAYLPNGTNIFGFKQQGTETSYTEVKVVGDTVDQESIAGSKVNGFKAIHNFGSSSSTGGRHAVYGVLVQDATTSATSTDRNYVGVQGQVITDVSDGGTAPDFANGKGAYFGMSSIATIQSGATNLLNVTGAEINTRVLSGSSVAYIAGLQVVTKDVINGSVYDTALALSKGSTGTVGKNTGILFGNMNGSHPVNNTGTLIASTGSATVSKGIDFTSYTFTGDVLSAPNVGFKSTSIRATGSNATVELGSLSVPNTPAVDFHSSGNNIDYDGRIVCSGGTGVVGNGTLGVEATTLRPQPDNATSLGQASNRWTEVFAVAGTINTSDEREKQDISSLDEAELRVATALKGLVKKFRWKDAVAKKGDDARIHVGVIAQEVKAAFEAEGLDGFKYGVLCYDEWDEELDGNGYVMVVAGNRYGVRYEELFSFILAAL